MMLAPVAGGAAGESIPHWFPAPLPTPTAEEITLPSPGIDGRLRLSRGVPTTPSNADQWSGPGRWSMS